MHFFSLAKCLPKAIDRTRKGEISSLSRINFTKGVGGWPRLIRSGGGLCSSGTSWQLRGAGTAACYGVPYRRIEHVGRIVLYAADKTLDRIER